MTLLYALNDRSASTELVGIDMYVRAISANAGVRVSYHTRKTVCLQPAHHKVLVQLYDIDPIGLVIEHLGQELKYNVSIPVAKTSTDSDPEP